jgi:hypothetical protein
LPNAQGDVPIEPARIGAADESRFARRSNVPPTGAAFYPMFTTGNAAAGGCEWREGGPAVPGATNTFGGTPASFWGSPVVTFYPTGPATTTTFFENFERTLPNNPCPAKKP